jgi:hypothetical protein
MPHYIRLRGPWNYQPVACWLRAANGDWQLSPTDLPIAGVISLPSRWEGTLQGFVGSVVLTRRFRCPEAVAAAKRVWLGIEDLSGSASVELNGERVGELAGIEAAPENGVQKCPVRFEISQLLRPRNVLAITVTTPAPISTERQSGHLGLVRLEIESNED